MKLTPDGMNWSSGPWKYPPVKRPFIERGIWGYIAAAAVVLFVAVIAVDAMNGAIHDQINRDPMEVVE